MGASSSIMSWGKNEKVNFFKKIFLVYLITLLMSSFIFLIYRSNSLIGIFGIMIGFWIISNNIMSHNQEQ